jgi:hypothetical protein
LAPNVQLCQLHQVAQAWQLARLQVLQVTDVQCLEAGQGSAELPCINGSVRTGCVCLQYMYCRLLQPALAARGSLDYYIRSIASSSYAPDIEQPAVQVHGGQSLEYRVYAAFAVNRRSSEMSYIFIAQLMLQLMEYILAVPDVHGCRHVDHHMQDCIAQQSDVKVADP